MSKVDRVNKSLLNIVNEIITEKFYLFLPELKEVYLETYKEVLASFELPEYSVADPLLYIDIFEERLDEFEYIDDYTQETVDITIPTMDNFEFGEELVFIELISKDLLGVFIEVNFYEYKKLIDEVSISADLNRYVMSALPVFSDTTPVDLRFYILPYDERFVSVIGNILNKDLSIFPFSNFLPTDIFEAGQEYFEENIDSIINDSLAEAVEKVEDKVL